MYVYYRNVKIESNLGDDRDRPNEATKLNQQQTRTHTLKICRVQRFRKTKMK